MDQTPPFSLTIYSADVWTHACMAVRLVSPARRLGWNLIQGAEWSDGALQVFPERVAQADVVVITRDFPTRVAEYQQVIAEAQRHGKPVVYETDDLLLELPEQHPDYERYLTARAAMLQAVVEADVVVGSTPELCDYLRNFNANTHLWENYLDDRLWRLGAPETIASEQAETAFDRPVHIGYMGGQSHGTDLEPILPALIQILDKYPGKVGLKFWGLEPPLSLRHHPGAEYIPVRLVDYTSFAAYFPSQECELFIAPLQDNLFNRCKSPLKFLEYSALAVPGVYSRIAPYERLVSHGENGLLAGDPDEWVDCLSRLVEDPALRLRMGEAARATLQSQWLLTGHLDLFERLYRGFSAGTPPVRKDQTLQGLHIAQKMGAFYQDLLRARDEGSRNSEQVETLQVQLREQQNTLLNLNRIAQEYYALYLEIMHSRSWRLMNRLVDWRLRLAPLGSRRDRFFKAAYQSASALKNQGLGAFFRAGVQGARSVIKPPVQPQPDAQAVPDLQTLLFDGAMPAGAACTMPAISLIVIRDGADASAAAIADVICWHKGQTLRQAGQIVVWDRAAGEASLLDSQSVPWAARDISKLLQGLDMPYVCFASLDLLEQEATYLETNLWALQTGSLAFTVNLCGFSSWAIRRLEHGWLPGDRGRPLLRTVVRKECVVQGPDGQIDLDLGQWLEGRRNMLAGGPSLNAEPVIAGRVIPLTTSKVDLEGDLPFERRSPCTFLSDYLISTGPQFVPGNPPLAHLLFPLDQALPGAPEPCDLPTVFLIQPVLAVGGAEKIALKLIQNLTGQVRFIVLAFDKMEAELGTMADEFRQATPYVYTLPDFSDSHLNASAMDYLIARFDPRSIYIHNGSPWIYDALGEIKRRYPDIRLVDQVYDHQVGWINRYDPSVVLYLDGHIGSNPKICQAYRDKGSPPETVYFIENGSDSQELDPEQYDEGQIYNLKLKLGLSPQARVVTFASRVHPQKRPMDFVELARRFSSDLGVAFLMAGDGPLAAQVDEQIRKIGLKNIYRCPFYRPISDLLALTDVLVLPSEFEGMPMIVLEAQTMGKPVVVTDVGNNREVIERTQGGIVLSQIGDVGAIMKAVQQMLDSPPDPAEVRRKTIAVFDWKVIAQKYRAALLSNYDG
jgi:processive 1,2-diacylglycerol beta-glucosyltransferase